MRDATTTPVVLVEVALLALSTAGGSPDPTDLPSELALDLYSDVTFDERRVGADEKPAHHGGRCVFFLDMDSPDRGVYGGTDAQRAALLQELDEDWGEFNVEFHTTQPNEPHQACNIGYDDCPNYSNPTGQAGMDCNNGGGYGDNCWAAVCGGQIIPTNFQASIIGQELAHTFGLDHVTGKADILNPTTDGNGPDPVFNNECLELASNYCDHDEFCPGGGQNSYMEIAKHCGEAAPDMGPPTVEITFPSDGDTFQECADFDILAMASDDKRVRQVTLMSAGSVVAADGAEPWMWAVKDIPPGEYQFTAIAEDTAGNTTESAMVRVMVEATGENCATDPDDPDTPDPGPSSSDTGADTGPGGTDEGGLGTDGQWTGGLDMEREGGCGCTTHARPMTGALALTVLLGSWGRRRRRKHAD